MNTTKVIFFLAFASSVNLSFGQKNNLDTITVEGNLVTYISKTDLKESYNKTKTTIDITIGYFLFTLNKYEQCKKKEYKTLHQIDRKQNAIFLFQHGDDCFSTLNALFFNNKLNALNLNKTLYQSAKNYTFKDKKYLYKCTPIKVKCLRVFLSEKELIHFIAFNQYTFNFDNIPVYIIQEIIN